MRIFWSIIEFSCVIFLVCVAPDISYKQGQEDAVKGKTENTMFVHVHDSTKQIIKERFGEK